MYKPSRCIVVIGGSAGIGLETVKAGLAAGHRVRAFARCTERMQIHSESLEKLDGDALDPASVERAVADMDAVFLCLGVPMNLQLVTGPISLFSAATRIVLDAMAHRGTNRLVAVTGFGAGESAKSISGWQRPAFNFLFGHAYADKGLQESMIKRSELDWTIARPGVLTNGRKKEYRVLTTPSDWRNGIISRASVAEFLIRQLDSHALSGEAPVLINS